jgi:hypothetical protein
VDDDGGISAAWSERLVEAVREQYRLDWDGVHGYPHWVRVRENGLRPGSRSGAGSSGDDRTDPSVVSCSRAAYPIFEPHAPCAGLAPQLVSSCSAI